jgi:hypothetical protein
MRKLLLLAGAALIAALLPATSASAIVVEDGKIYWLRTGHGGGIGRIDVDGSGLKRLLVRGVTADDLAVDGSSVFWADSDKGVIGRARTDGRKVKRKLVKADADAIAAHDGSLYWLDDGIVGRARANGRGVKRRFLNVRRPGWDASGLAVGPAGIFWGQGVAHGKAWDEAREGGPVGRIGRAGLSGGGIEHGFADWRAAVLISSAPRVIGLDGPSLYWLTANPDNVLHHLAAGGESVGTCQPVLSNCEVLMRLADERLNPNSQFAVADGVLYWATPVHGGTRIHAAPIARDPDASELLQPARQVAFVHDALR